MGHHHHQQQINGNGLLFSILLNIVITVAQVIGGLISGSLALISDALHNLSDVISLIISYVANLLNHRNKQTIRQTFGYKRAEIIAAFINAISLIVIAIFLAYKALNNFFNVHDVKSDIVIWLALLGVLANGLSVLIIKKDAEHNLNMKSAYIHLLADMLTSIAVFFGGLLMKYYQIYWIDSVVTLIIVIYLIYMSWDILVQSLKILMLFAPEHIVIREVEIALLELKEIKNIHHVHIWQLNEYDFHLEAHIEFKKDIKLSDFDGVCEQIEKLLLNKFNINHCNLQPEYFRNDIKEFIIQD